MQLKRFAGGDFLVRQDDLGDSLMVISNGDANVVLLLADGSESWLRKVTRGDVVGEMALVTREPRYANVVAADRVEAYVLPVEAFDALALRHPNISVVLTELVSERLGNERIDAMSTKLLNGYRIQGCVGRGGMAIVYDAIAEASREHVALKMMDHRLIYDSPACSRFQREADVAESLAHENIVRVHGRFEAYRTYFLIMEYVEGPTLGQFIRAIREIPEAVIKMIIGQLACALAVIHAKQLAHRDLKPSNVLLSRDGKVKLTDFGLARPVFDRSVTQQTTIVGTPAYMAPEQLFGGDYDARVDLYALGCIAYEMLTGEALFRANSLSELINMKRTWVLPERQVVRADLGEDLYELLARALHRDPAERLVPLGDISEWARPLDPLLIARVKGVGVADSDATTLDRQ